MRTLSLAAALTTALIATDARAFGPGEDSGLVTRAADTRTFTPARWTTPARVAPAFARFVAATGPWQAVWDADTDVPTRLWGAGLSVPGAQQDPAIAARAARDLVEAHLDLFAPGTAAGELELIGNAEVNGLRQVTFAQRWSGMRVAGATVVAMFKRDRLIVLGSSALPDVTATIPASAAAPSSRAATRWLADETGHDVTVKDTGAPVVFAEVRARGAGGPDVRFTVARPLVVESTAGVGRWSVWVDAATGEPLARVSRILYGDGTLTYNTPAREATGARAEIPAAFAAITVDGQPVTSSFAGGVTWTGAASANIVTALIGPHAVTVDGGGHPLASATLSLTPGGSVSFSAATDEFGDAQITTFAHINLVKRMIRHQFDPTLPWVDGQTSVSANENQNCNAFADLDPDNVHFFINGSGCENTGRMPDVVYHEAGHNFHFRSMIASGAITDIGGFFTNPDVPALSEGTGDTLASAMTNSPDLGPGFFLGNPGPPRSLDPVGVEKVYPNDLQGESHADGEIFGGTIWDLRKALVLSLGDVQGQIATNRIFNGIVAHSLTFTAMYTDALAADDDDGNLANGTPHQCEISTAFATHGLAPAPAGGVTVGTPAVAAGTLSVPITTPVCPGPAVTGVTVTWQVRGDASMTGTIPLVAAGAAWTGAVPALPDGTVIQYTVAVATSDGSTVTRPLNAADPQYEAFLGAATAISCDDFEADHGWTHAATTGTDEWTRGAPLAPAAGDPTAAASGGAVLGMDLADNGLYAASSDTYAETPAIDVAGYATVRLQYARWLDADATDPATITANGTEVWASSATVAHRDGEWRFHDVDLTTQAATGTVAVRFGLVTDGATQRGGWSIDDVCVVGYGAVCGDTLLKGTEQCDDGNLDDGDGCSATCATEPPDEGGCCSTGTDPRGALVVSALGALGLLGVLRRRRRR